jgi:hypothetical protein
MFKVFNVSFPGTTQTIQKAQLKTLEALAGVYRNYLKVPGYLDHNTFTCLIFNLKPHDSALRAH